MSGIVSSTSSKSVSWSLFWSRIAVICSYRSISMISLFSSYLLINLTSCNSDLSGFVFTVLTDTPVMTKITVCVSSWLMSRICSLTTIGMQVVPSRRGLQLICCPGKGGLAQWIWNASCLWAWFDMSWWSIHPHKRLNFSQVYQPIITPGHDDDKHWNALEAHCTNSVWVVLSGRVSDYFRI